VNRITSLFSGQELFSKYLLSIQKLKEFGNIIFKIKLKDNHGSAER